MQKTKAADPQDDVISVIVDGPLQRIDRFLGQHLCQYSRTRQEALFAEKRILLNGKVCKKSEKVKKGDQISLSLPQIILEHIPQADATLLERIEILFEDEWILAVNKPSGLSVHPGSGKREFTIADYFRHRYPDAAALFSDPDRPGIVHRLDKDTSGILLSGKNPQVVEKLQNQFRDREISKSYMAWVDGVVKTPFRRISSAIIRHPRLRIRYTTAETGAPGSREALTEFRLLAVRNGRSLLRIRLFTGRTHQIRVHMSSIGHPVSGDSLYGSRLTSRSMPEPGIMLHAHRLSFRHPFLEQSVTLYSSLPERMRSFWHAHECVCQDR